MGISSTFLLCVALLAATVMAAARQKRMLDCTIESQSLDQCDIQAYATRLFIFAAPGIILFLILWLCCPFYCGAKYCCNCCGGRHQTPNCCCPSEKYPARYSQGDIVRPRVYAVLALLITAGALGWSYSGIVDLLGGLEDLRVVVEDVPQALQYRIDEIEASLIIRTYDATTKEYSTTNLFQQNALANTSRTVKDDLKKAIDSLMVTYRQYVGYFTKAIIAIFAIPAGVMLVGQIASACSCRKILPMIFVWILLLVGGLTWFGHGMFSLLSMAIGDTCAEIDGMVAQQTNVLPVVLGCEDSMFDDFRNNFRALESEQAGRTCTLLMARCYDSSKTVSQNLAAGTIYVCPPASSANCSTQTFGTLLTLSESYWYVHPDITNFPGSRTAGYTCSASTPCTIKACSTECVTASGALSETGHVSLDVWSKFLAVNQVSNAIDTVGAQYSNCDSVMLVVMGPAAGPCDKLTSGLVYARQASGLEGIAIVIAIFAFIWGAKRFISLDEAGKPQMDGREPKPNPDEQIQ